MQEMNMGLKEFPVHVQYDHIFFFGDLNYRLDTTGQLTQFPRGFPLFI